MLQVRFFSDFGLWLDDEYGYVLYLPKKLLKIIENIYDCTILTCQKSLKVYIDYMM